MDYTPGRVYRHKRRVGKKYLPRAFEPLDAVLFLAVALGFVAALLAWCRGVI